MINEKILADGIDDALQASEELLQCVQTGKWEEVKSLNNVRMQLIRMLSLCQKTDSFWQKFGKKLNQLKELDRLILTGSEELRDRLATQIRHNQEKKQGFVEYIRQQSGV